MNRRQLNEIIDFEKDVYSRYMFPNRIRYILSYLKHEPSRRIFSWQKISRKADYYNLRRKSKNPFMAILYLYYTMKRNRLGEKLGLEIITLNIGKGFLVYHYNNVINSKTIIGDNCHIHGGNVIGNSGPHDKRCPIIGNNVMIGAGAKIIGNVKIADGIKVAAGAVVVTSFEEPNITIAGVPARKVK